MFVGLESTPRDYAWGSRTAIADLLGRPASGEPEAELWLGAHPAWPSTVSATTSSLAGRRLDDVLDGGSLLGGGRDRLPFLLKVLAADSALSLQVHPDADEAREGFARENEAGIPLDAPERNYRDDSDKPELILALSATFEALAGFRHVSETRLLLAELAGLASGEDLAAIVRFADRLADGDPAAASSTGSSTHVLDDGVPATGDTSPEHTGEGNPLATSVEWLLGGSDEAGDLVAAVVRAAARAPATSSFAREWTTTAVLAAAYAGDPGIVLALLLNRVSLRQGQVLELPAGVIHAYLVGTGIELMSSSDNVLRGGLTPKHVDVSELLRVVRFEAQPPQILVPRSPVLGVEEWRPTVGDFRLARVGVGPAAAVHGVTDSGPASAAIELTGPAVLLVVAGGIQLDGSAGGVALGRGDAVYVSPDEGRLTVSGSGVAFVATTP